VNVAKLYMDILLTNYELYLERLAVAGS
jgi:hypothetical protein